MSQWVAFRNGIIPGSRRLTRAPRETKSSAPSFGTFRPSVILDLLRGYLFILFFHHTPPNAEKPPSTGTTIPVTNAEAGERSHRTVPSKSSGSPKRFIGV